MPERLNVLFLAAEAEPFIKVGGLGDVAGSLPRFLRNLQPEVELGNAPDVRLILPRHSAMRANQQGDRPFMVFAVPCAAGPIPVQAFLADLAGVPVYLLDAEPIARTASVYSADAALDAEKYLFFSLAALELSRRLDWRPNVLHCHDWHTALACYAILLRRREGLDTGIATVLTVHNLPYMGPDVAALLPQYGLPEVQTGLPAWARTRPLALGLWASDAIVAVSPSYAREIQTREGGAGLQDYMSARRESLHGILNGIDTESFNPATDPALTANYGIPTLERRVANKAALQAALGLSVAPEALLFGVVSRLDPQKGLDLLAPGLRRLRNVQWQAVILGSGTTRLERALKRLEQEFPDRVRAEIRYDAEMARRIYGGADALLMPSKYEPCGLAQMIAMRYGCLPIVSAVGGLNDTVVDGETGFVMGTPTAAHLTAACRRAVQLFTDKAQWMTMQRKAMATNFSWSSSARQYLELYRTLQSQAVPRTS